MSTGKGFKGVLVAARQTALATPIAATDLIPFYSESLEMNPELIDTEYISGDAGILAADEVFNPLNGSIEIPILYNKKASSSAFKGSSILIAAAMGQGGTFASGDLQLLLDDSGFNADSSRACLTLAVQKQVSVWENIGCYINSMAISGNAKENIRASFEVIGYNQDLSSSTNTSSTISTLKSSMDSDGIADHVLFSECDIYAGDTVDALTSSDRVSISGFTLTLNNNLSESEAASIDNTAHTNILKTLEPVQNGMRTVTLEITIPRYTANTWISWKENQTHLQFEIHAIRTSNSKEFHIFIPEMVVESVSAPISGGNLVTQTVTCKCLIPDHQITKFSDGSTIVTTEFGIDTDDERTVAIW